MVCALRSHLLRLARGVQLLALLLLLGACGTVATEGVGQPLATAPPALDAPVPTADPLSSRRETGASSEVRLAARDPLEVGDPLIVTGSSSLFPLMQAVTQRFTREGFRGPLNLSSTGTAGGFELLCSGGEVHLVMASRPIRQEEMRTCLASGRVPVEFAIAMDHLSVLVDIDNNFATDLTLDELNTLFSAERWSDVNPAWPAVPIVRYIPAEGSGTFDYFVERVFEGDPTALLSATNVVHSGNPTALAVGIGGTPGSVGFAAHAIAVSQPQKLKVLSIEGVAADSISTDYPLSRPLLLYADLHTLRRYPALATYLTFVLEKVERELLDAGYFPAPQAAFDAGRARLLELFRGDIHVAGSTTVLPLALAARDALDSAGYDGYILAEGSGSSRGIEQFCDEQSSDIALTSRPIEDEEVDRCLENGRSPLALRVGSDALAIIVPRENDFLTTLTTEQFVALYAAERWSEVDPAWPDRPIEHFITGRGTGGTGIIVDELYGGDEARLFQGPALSEVATGLEMAALVADSSDGIGVVAYALFKQFEDALRVVPLNGVEPTRESVEAGDYPLARPLLAYTDRALIQARPQVGSYLYQLLSTLDESTPALGYFAPSDRLFEENLSLLTAALRGARLANQME